MFHPAATAVGGGFTPRGFTGCGRTLEMAQKRWWTTPSNADAYENFLKQNIIPQLRSIEGHRGAEILRRDLEDESEFMVINYFESIEAVKRFAGENYTVPVFEPEASKLL